MDDLTVEITELPVRTWTQKYKEFLETLLHPSQKREPQIEEYVDRHTDTDVHFTVRFTPEQMVKAESVGLEKFLRLEKTTHTRNMVLFTPDGELKRYENTGAIFEDFVNVRLDFYAKRKKARLEALLARKKRVDNMVREARRG